MSEKIETPQADQPPPKRGRVYWGWMGGKFLVISILVHVLFITGAAYYVIQKYQPKRLSFKAGAPSANPAKQLQEHKVKMARKQKSMSAPAPTKRVTTTMPSKITLPDMPLMPVTSVVAPTEITGMGGFGSGFGGGNGDGGGGGGNGFTSPFGYSDARTGALVGIFYDLKHLRGREDVKDVGKVYETEIQKFVGQGWNKSVLNKYLQGLHPLYATEIFFPNIETNDAPKAFGSPLPDSPGKWVAVYRGQVSPVESGVYHFVAAGDDDMIIRFDRQLVLFNCEHVKAPGGQLKNTRGCQTLADSFYKYKGEGLMFARSLPITVSAGQSYEIDILIGDDVPTKTFAKILIEKEGTTYQKEGDSPILPVFALEKVIASGTDTPRHTSDGPFWKGRATTTSLLDIDQ